jgi:S1-C subfamily serine protease
MKKPLYSRSPRSHAPAAGASGAAPRAAGAGAAAQSTRAAVPTPPAAPVEPLTAAAAAPARRSRLRSFFARHRRVTWVAAGIAVVGLAGWLHTVLQPVPYRLTQEDIDAAVLRTLKETTLPSEAARAYAAVAPSVVRVRGLGDPAEEAVNEPDPDPTKESEKGIGTGTGVVIVDKGIILTNLHVVIGAKRIKVTFHDGHEADAKVIGVQADQDLAVLQALSIPDDLVAATLRSTNDLQVGDHVVAVGFPFGIGPSASAGVVSGLKREFRSPEGKRVLTNLIQFDAAANPGNSGGPLVTAGGEVVGIVTGILNPTEQRVFIGIGFAVPIESAAGAVGLSPF